MVGELIGEGAAGEEAVVGETPNLAARLQGLAEPGAVVIAEATRRLLGGLFAFQDLGATSLKGFAEPVRAYRVLGEGAAEGRFEALRAAGLTPLVGREQELALLLDRWARAAAGEGQAVLLSGEPGIGKSRLVQALRERVVAERHTRLLYQCSPYHAGSALHPVVAQLERAADFARDDGAEARLDKLRRPPRRHGRGPGPGRGPPRRPDGRRPPRRDGAAGAPGEDVQGARRPARGFGRAAPVLAVLEDAHWIDPTTEELFDLVIERVQRLPVLLVVTFRPEFRPRWSSHSHATPRSCP